MDIAIAGQLHVVNVWHHVVAIIAGRQVAADGAAQRDAVVAEGAFLAKANSGSGMQKFRPNTRMQIWRGEYSMRAGCHGARAGDTLSEILVGQQRQIADALVLEGQGIVQ